MGERRHWVTFESPETEMDSDGAQVETWVPAFPLNHRMPCQVRALSGRELFAAQASQSKVSTEIVTQYRPGFKASMRGRLGAEVFNIEAVILDPESRNRTITLRCSSGVNLG